MVKKIVQQKLLKFMVFIMVVFCSFSFVACGNSQNDDLKNQTNTEIENNNVQNDIVKVTGAADDVGIYVIVVELKSGAADKGVIEMVYNGPKGTPQENSVVNTFRIEYYKEDVGTYEIKTFSDNKVYLNLHHQTKMKVTNEFGALVRAGDVTISYTPDGGTTQKIYTATADQFRI